MDKTKQELKACPHCGNTDIDPEEVMAQDPDGRTYTYPGCGCVDSIESWNTRTEVPHTGITAEDVEKLERWKIADYDESLNVDIVRADDGDLVYFKDIAALQADESDGGES